MICGFTGSQIFLLQLSPDGEIISIDFFGSPSTAQFIFDAEYTPQGDIVFSWFGSNFQKIEKVSATMDPIWVYDVEYAFDLEVTDNGEVIALKEPTFWKLDDLGQVVWETTLDFPEAETYYEIELGPNGETYFCGWLNNGQGQIPIAGTVDVSGNASLFNPQPIDSVFGTFIRLETMSDGILLNSFSAGTGNFPTYTIKTDFNGNVIWATPQPLQMGLIDAAEDGGIYAANIFGEEIIIQKLDANGNINLNLLQGNIYANNDQDCDQNEATIYDFSNWTVSATSPLDTFVTLTNVF